MQPVFVTGVGSWPGTDITDACQIVFDVAQHLPFLPELPERGYGADTIGRTMALVMQADANFAIRTTASGWQLDGSIGRDSRRAMSYLERDIDVMHETFSDYEGDFKVQVVGPWTLAASVELATGQKILGDIGATRDLSAALVEATRAHVVDVQTRLPKANVVLQCDEPMLAKVQYGAVPTASGWHRYHSVEAHVLTSVLTDLITGHGGAASIVHDCSSDFVFEALKMPGLGWSLDISILGSQHFDLIGEHIESGGFLVLGIDFTSQRQAIAKIKELGSSIGYSVTDWARSIGVSPTCGLAHMSVSDARKKIEFLNTIARAMHEELE